MLAPVTGVRLTVEEAASPAGLLAVELLRWFGVMTFTFGGVLLALALRSSNSGATMLVIKAFAVGDVAYTVTAALWLLRHASPPFELYFNVAFSSVLLAGRCVALVNPAAVVAKPGNKLE